MEFGINQAAGYYAGQRMGSTAGTTPVIQSIIEAMIRTEYRLRLHVMVADDRDRPDLTAWADGLRTAINEAKGLK